MATNDVISILKADHKKVKALYAEFDELGDRAFAQRQKLGVQIASELEAHSEAEKQVLYPAFKERAETNTDEREAVLEAEEEHAHVDEMVRAVKSLDGRDETFRPKVKVMYDLVEHHVKEEERTFFPMCREVFDAEELVELGERVLELKRRVQQRQAAGRGAPA